MSRSTSPEGSHAFQASTPRLLLSLSLLMPLAPAWAQCNGGVPVTSMLTIGSSCDGYGYSPLTLSTGADVTIALGVTVSNDAYNGRFGDPVSVPGGVTANRFVNNGTLYTDTQWGITVAGTLTELINNGTIQSGVRRAIVINGGAVGTLTNTGTLIGPYASVTNSGTLQTFNNLQGAGNSTGAVVYNGNLPSVYNIIINSPTTYGQLVSAGISGTMAFGIYSGSTVTAGTYSGVLSGFSAGDLTGPLTGVYSGYTWTLALASGTTWDLIFAASARTSYTSYARGANEASVGRYLDAMAAASTTADGAALVQRLDGLSAAQAQAALHSLSGATHATTSSLAMAMSRGFSAALGGSGLGANGGAMALQDNGPRNYASLDLAQAPATTLSDAGPGVSPAARGLWVQALGSGGRIASDGNADGTRWRGDGFVLGYEQPWLTDWAAGAAIGYTRSNWDATSGAGASGRVETPQLGLYARSTGDGWRTRVHASFADHDLSADRVVDLGSSTAVAHSSHGGREWGVGAQIEKPIASGAWQLLPLAGLRYASLSESGFTESGAGAADLTVQGRTTRNTTVSAGLQASQAFGSGQGAFELRAIASYLMGDNDSPLSASLAGQVGSFTANGVALRRAALSLGGGLQGRIARGVSAYADASYELRGGGQNAFQFAAGVRAAF